MENSNRIRRKHPYFKNEPKIKRDGTLFDNEEYTLRHKTTNEKTTRLKQLEKPLSEMSEFQLIGYCKLKSRAFLTVKEFTYILDRENIRKKKRRWLINEYIYQLNERYDELRQEGEERAQAKRKRNQSIKTSAILLGLSLMASSFFNSGRPAFFSVFVNFAIDYGVDFVIGTVLSFIVKFKTIEPIALKLDLIEEITDEGKSPKLIQFEEDAQLAKSVLSWFVFFLLANTVRKLLYFSGSDVIEANLYWLDYAIDYAIDFVIAIAFLLISKTKFVNNLIQYIKINRYEQKQHKFRQ